MMLSALSVADRRPSDAQPSDAEPSDGWSSHGRRLRVDLHIHTLASDGISDVETILAAAEARGLDAIAITDHERIDAAQAAGDIAHDGIELSKRDGHAVGHGRDLEHIP